MKKALTVSLFIVVFGIVLNVLNPDFSPIKKAITSIVDTSATQKVTKLEEEISILNQKLVSFQSLERENKKLKTLLDINTQKEYKKIYANVVSLSIADEIFITIDKGAKSNIKQGDILKIKLPYQNRQGSEFYKELNQNVVNSKIVVKS